jgi:hypothetical protein
MVLAGGELFTRSRPLIRGVSVFGIFRAGRYHFYTHIQASGLIPLQTLGVVGQDYVMVQTNRALTLVPGIPASSG